jgi:hypothetical protein
MLLSLYWFWRRLKSSTQAHYPAWALAAQKLLPRDTFSKESWGDCDGFLQEATAINGTVDTDQPLRAAVVVGWYRRAPWTDEELIQLIRADMNLHSPTSVELLENLGSLGNDALRDLQREEPRW